MEDSNKKEKAIHAMQDAVQIALSKNQPHPTQRADQANKSNPINDTKNIENGEDNAVNAVNKIIANEQMIFRTTDRKQSKDETLNNMERVNKRKRKCICLDESKKTTTNTEKINNSSENEEKKISFEEGDLINVQSVIPQPAALEEYHEEINKSNKCITTVQKEENGDIRFIVQLQNTGGGEFTHNSIRSPTKRRRSRSRTTGCNKNCPGERKRRRREDPQISNILPPEEIENVEYETIYTVPRKMTKTWRSVPKYKLTILETAQQEADLYFSFLKENIDHEQVRPVQSGERECCICYENMATRIIVPCGHLCLCYNCAKTIALNRSSLSSGLIAKKCPLCQAAISKMIRPV